MSIIGRITSKGQTTLPVEVRQLLGVMSGDEIEYVISDDGSVTLRKPKFGLQDLRGIVKLDFPVTGADIDAWCRDVRANGWQRE